MPESRPPIRAHPAKPFRTIQDCAHDNQLILLRCNNGWKRTCVAGAKIYLLSPTAGINITSLPLNGGRHQYIGVITATFIVLNDGIPPFRKDGSVAIL